MSAKRSRAAQIFDKTVDSVENATVAAGHKVKRGLDRAAEVVADFDSAHGISGKATTAGKKAAKKASATVKKAVKTTAGAKKASTPVKKATKKAAGAKKASTPAKSTAKKSGGAKAAPVKTTAKKVPGVKKAGGTK